ncbi:acyl-CoA dehydrogenase family protein [Hoeflea poritis]|uniref:Acyl-CoA dehydrogenase family protein n=1 Tax=Hoeflea poritis TaxID=2993659 RepID=A0ABT4VV57_9HYPH|nr:acyl-CoA dehydrogenase family protein [Hoeflea poritis]MDA4848514.1 acyl-CoA dehydrogenase family protein [Hoeflea poritis]
MLDSLLTEAADRFFQDHYDQSAGVVAESSETNARLWSLLVENGLTFALVPESLGGAGLTLMQAFAILKIGGKHASPVPLAETMLSNWLLAMSGSAPSELALSVAPQHPGDSIHLTQHGRLVGTVRSINFASQCDQLVVMATSPQGIRAVVVRPDDCIVQVKPGTSPDPIGDIDLSRVTPISAGPNIVSRRRAQFLGAVAYAAQMAGALEAMLEITTDYVQVRSAFGRTLSKFQAVQQNLATLACEVAAANSAVASAADALDTIKDDDDPALLLECASAKIRVGEAASLGSTIAHQAHGATGYTAEYVLSRYSRRIWGWRDQFGSESDWAIELGNEIAKQGADELWPLIASR